MANNPDRCASCTSAKVDAFFTAKVLPLVDTIRANIMESRTLGATGDALLPKLLSGGIRVPEAFNSLVGQPDGGGRYWRRGSIKAH